MKCKFSVCPLETDCNIVLVSGQRVQTGDAHQDAQVLEAEGGQRLPDAHLRTVVRSVIIQRLGAPYPAGILHTLIELGHHVHLE